VIRPAIASAIGLGLGLLLGACACPRSCAQAEPRPPARRAIATAEAPAPVGPYSQAIAVGGVLYAAGQIGIDPATGELVAGGVEAEARAALDHLGAVLRAAGLDFGDVVQVQLFLADIGDFAAVNAIYAERFGAAPPARATVQVAALPKGARVEILATAVRARD
jgi:2-iminobutanoate/2-iminopropanoate deaminase